MRKMISSKQAKVLNNLVVNNDGTIVEVGGNLAVESIEQLGTASVVTIPGYVEIKNNPAEYVAEKVVATGVTSVIELGTGWSTSSFLPTATTEGDVAFKDVAGAHYLVLRIGDDFYYTNVDGATMKVNGTATVVEGSMAKSIPSHDELEFTPFFTEEQYEALLDLIENHDALLDLIENA